MKKFLRISLFSSLFMFLVFGSTSAFANEEVYEKLSEEELSSVSYADINVSTKSPVSTVNDSDIITPFGTSTPTQAHHLVNDGQMDFSGSAQGSALYTNKYFTGKSSVNIYVRNSHSSAKLTVKIIDIDGWFGGVVKTYTIEPGYQLYANPTGLDSKGRYYLEFSAPSNFSGYVN
ncbi:hypothetical protein [Bacillus sp. FJAT-27445]|uniref:hypothetical protein n=1 Tax=Bacillus sp. FJAT-27445 TaxID=1679166 RepID=UPI0007445408|nr:hypothetical protein [Bacillus sp. FJAT-27445]